MALSGLRWRFPVGDGWAYLGRDWSIDQSHNARGLSVVFQRCLWSPSLRTVSARQQDDHTGRPCVDRGARGRHLIVGMTNSAPSLVPEGQRDVTVLVFV
jgi:hypothetical protein